jgi:hypothetical protein
LDGFFYTIGNQHPGILLQRNADLAALQVFNLSRADCKSAAQQVRNLRYRSRARLESGACNADL